MTISHFDPRAAQLTDPSRANAGYYPAVLINKLIDQINELIVSPVTSVFGRVGSVVAVTGDYDASQIDNDSGVSGTTVSAALDTLSSTLGGKQPLDGDLTAIAGFSSVGIAVRTGSNSWEQRTLAAASGSGIGIINPGGVAGNITLDMPPGSVVQSVMGTYTTSTAISTAVPLDDTIPQNTEGTQIISVAITPRSTTNKLRARFRAEGATSAALTSIVAALFRNSEANAAAATLVTPGGVDFMESIDLEFEWVPGSVTSQTIALRVGPTSGNAYLNGNASGRFFGGTMAATLVVEEIRA